MQITTEELQELLTNAKSEARELPALRERVLKLEHKLNEMCDVLTDLRAHQIMTARDNNIPSYMPGLDETDNE